MDNIILNIILGWVRTGLAAIFGGMVANGVLTHDQETTVIGAILTIVPIAFSAWDKFHAREVAQDAAAKARADVGAGQ